MHSDGDNGRGKSLSLAHVLHYCYSAGWFILPVPSGKGSYNEWIIQRFNCKLTSSKKKVLMNKN